MKINKKIGVWCLLCALMLALVPTCSAKANTTETTADDVKYRDIEEFMHGMGYLDFSKLDNALYYVFSYDEYLFVLEQQNCKNAKPYTCIAPNQMENCLFFIFEENIGYTFYAYEYYIPALASKYDNYTCLDYSSRSFGDAGFDFLDVHRSRKYVNYEQNPIYNISNLVFSDVDIYSTDVSDWRFYRDVKNLVFESTANGLYSFPAWCLDVGLNPVSSTNESPSKIPYSYNNYWHIVRKTSAGKWLLTTVGNSVSADNVSDYTFVYSEDMGALKVLNLYSGEDTNGYLLDVRQYEYDTDGWKVRTFETFDARDTDDNIIDLGAGSGIDDTKVLAFTSVDIYDESFNLVTPASTECVDPSVPDITPEPTPDAEVTPSVGVQSQLLYLYTTEFQGTVITPYASIYEVTNGSDDDILCDLLKGMNVTIHGWTVDSGGNTWYYCTYTNVYEGEVTGEFTGFVKGDSVGITYGAGDTTEEQDMTLAEQLQIASSLVLSVPLIIGSLFSFMPPWCLTFVGLAFSITALLLVLRK